MSLNVDDNESKPKLTKDLHETRNSLTKIMKTEGNSVCADCSGSKPVWAVKKFFFLHILLKIFFTHFFKKKKLKVVNLGIFVCINCSGIHRQMGVHISKVRSVTMDVFDRSQLSVKKKKKIFYTFFFDKFFFTFFFLKNFLHFFF